MVVMLIFNYVNHVVAEKSFAGYGSCSLREYRIIPFWPKYRKMALPFLVGGESCIRVVVASVLLRYLRPHQVTAFGGRLTRY